VICNFEIIGEAASRISSASRGRRGLPWRKIIAFRNRLIHGYWSVDPILVWDVVTKDLPVVKVGVERLLEENFGSGGPEPS